MSIPLYGFVDLQHLWDQRTTEVGVRVIAEAIQQSVDEHNKQVDALLSLFVSRTTDFKVKFKTATVTRNQPLDDNGRARPIQPAGHYEVAFPLQFSGNAWGANYRTRQKQTVEEANNLTQTLLDGDLRWVRDYILAALFTPEPWTYKDEEHGDLVIKGLANADDDTYQIQAGADTGATDEHYSAQAEAISDSADPFETIYTDLVEHPENQGEVVAFIPTNLKSAVTGLTEFHPLRDPNMAYGSASDLYVGELGAAVPGELIGYHESGVHIVHWRSLPGNTIVSTMTGGERALKMREEPEAELRGFRRVAEREDHPYWEAQYIRFAGFGAWNRIGAHIHRVGSAAYTIPTYYGSPMP